MIIIFAEPRLSFEIRRGESKVDPSARVDAFTVLCIIRAVLLNTALNHRCKFLYLGKIKIL
jgi:hypothetical protein